MKISTLIITTIVLLASGKVSNDPLAEKFDAYCKKVTVCALEVVKDRDIPNEYRKLLMDGIKNKCEAVRLRFQPYAQDPNLVKGAEACVDSLNALNCEQLMHMTEDTKECEDVSQLVEGPK
ncbi:hypothetical protein [Kangiella sp. TOML190]|uniref:hypothetical protein n=1 Tax=Kangiella sp. TOML190 TaxID=2931351 RepID=UPI00203ACCF6|nr:hypothetical protein [Kangiella sp. TOML190]